MRLNDWIIFYGDGSRFPAADELIGAVRPEDAPVENVQAIAIADPKQAPDSETLGRWVLDTYDFYLYSDPIGWHATNRFHDVLDHLKQGISAGGVRALLTGRWINTEAFKEIMERAKTEGRFDAKSARRHYPDSGVETD